jgi:hypothetical protein
VTTAEIVVAVVVCLLAVVALSAIAADTRRQHKDDRERDGL